MLTPIVGMLRSVGWTRRLLTRCDAYLREHDVWNKLERSFGGMPLGNGEVVRTNRLSTEILADLFNNRVCAVHVSGYMDPKRASDLGGRFVDPERLTHWGVRDENRGAYVATGVKSFGTPLSHVHNGIIPWDEYLNRALPTIELIRSVFAPDLSPLDRLRLELDELWPSGAHVWKLRGRSFVPGIVRVMEAENANDQAGGEYGGIHVDDLAPSGAARGVFSANMYLTVPPEGGELAIYDVRASSWWDILRNQSIYDRFGREDDESQAALRSLLPPAILLKPAPGDLVLINTGRPHAVRGWRAGYRVNLQAFIDYERSRPLKLRA